MCSRRLPLASTAVSARLRRSWSITRLPGSESTTPARIASSSRAIATSTGTLAARLWGFSSLDLGPGIGDPVLDRLLVGQPLVADLALDGPLAEHPESPVGLAYPAHAVVDPAWAEPHLRDREAFAALAEEVAGGHPALAVE